MKKIVAKLLVLSIIHLSFVVPAFAAKPASSVKVKSGIRVSVIVPYIKTSSNTIAGEKINAKIENNVQVNNVLVFKAGDGAVLNVADVKKTGYVGTAGELLLIDGRITDANGNTHPIEFYHKITGDEKTYPKVLLGIGIFLLWPLAFFAFVKGGDATIIQYAPLEVTLTEDFTFSAQNL